MRTTIDHRPKAGVRLHEAPAPPAPQRDERWQAAESIRDELERTNRMIAFFTCECGPSCVLTVPLTASEYDGIRPGSIYASAHRPGS